MDEQEQGLWQGVQQVDGETKNTPTQEGRYDGDDEYDVKTILSNL